ncbi:Uncharacterised protein [Mycobacteroides abscessus subsp. abscessus]|nr:Uncharacterised protein [Mycobacteroides abscessus subsp. abscessus]
MHPNAAMKAEYGADASIRAIAFVHSHSYGYVHAHRDRNTAAQPRQT